MKNFIAACVGGASLLVATSAFGQESDTEALLSLGDGELVGELDRRYEAGLALSLDEAIIAANDPRYQWALETKVQCAIALGFMESSTRDRTSINNCNLAYNQMNSVASRPATPPRVVQAPPQRRPDGCDDDIVGLVFFEFDSAMVSSDANQILQAVVSNIAACGWTSLAVVGHTDQSGTDSYNQGLSEERASAVTNALRSRGVSIPIDMSAEGESNPRVPLPDGTRSPQNRRVEISAD